MYVSWQFSQFMLYYPIIHHIVLCNGVVGSAVKVDFHNNWKMFYWNTVILSNGF